MNKEYKMVRARLRSIDRGIKSISGAVSVCAICLFILALHSCSPINTNGEIIHELRMIKYAVEK